MLLSLALAACGVTSSSGSSGTTLTSVKRSSITSSEPKAYKAARQVSLRLSDLPGPWQIQTASNPPVAPGPNVNQCLGITIPNPLASVTSPTYQAQGNNKMFASSITSVWSSESFARQDFAGYLAPRYEDCQKANWGPAIVSNCAQGGHIDFSRFSDSAEGNPTFGLRSNIVCNDGTTYFSDYVDFINGPMEVGIGVFSTAGIPNELVSEIADNVASRATFR